VSKTKTPQLKQPPEAFRLVYRKIAAPLAKFIVHRMYDDPNGADEVFSETVIAAWIGWQRFEHKSSYLTWITRIALNKMADYYRSQINRRSHLVAPLLETIASIPSKELTPEEKIVLKELRTSVKKCLLALPPEKQKLLYLRYWEDLTIKKIALIMGTSERSIEGQIYRARLSLKEIIRTRYPELAYSPAKKH
jgi:RNA polymerase sigma-70 factor, ECF subfamily